MDPTPPLDAVVTALRHLAEALAEDLPDLAVQLVAIVREASGDFGDATEGGASPIAARIARAVSALVDAGPDAWAALSERLALWTADAFGGELSGSPVGVALERVAHALSALAARTIAGETRAGEHFDAIVTPWLERFGAACVDAMMGGRP